MADIDSVIIERQWQSTGGATVRVGSAGEKWFAWHSRRGRAWVCDFERSTAALADQWLARGQWTEVSESAATISP